MSDLLQQLKQVGQLISQGEFTLDTEAAGSKMARFQFRDESHLITQWAAALFHLGAKSLEIQISPQEQSLVLRPEGIKLPDSLPKNLPQHLLDEASPYRRLAAACLASLALRPNSFAWLGHSKGQLYNSLDSTSTHWRHVQLESIHLVGLGQELLARGQDHLRRSAAFCRRPLTLNGSGLGGMPINHSWQSYQGNLAIDSSQSESQLDLVVDEMLTDPKRLQLELPWQGTVYWTGPLDASLASVIENEDFQNLVASLPSTFAKVLGDNLRVPLVWSPTRVRFCLDLLQRDPKLPWLAPNRERLEELLLFADHLGSFWSLEQLRAQKQPLLHSPSPIFEKVPHEVLLKSDAEALACLQLNLEQPPQEANSVLLRERLREHHQSLWRSRPQQMVKLPPGNWLAQLESEGLWSIGIPSDWSCPGGSLSILHQGRWLAEMKLDHSEIPCQAILDIPKSYINELWDGLSPEAQPIWTQFFQEKLELLVKQLAHESTGDHPKRWHLVEYLSRVRQPEKSHFAESRLFRDCEGQWWSLKGLLGQVGLKRSLGWLELDETLDSVPPRFRPDALWLKGSRVEFDCLCRVKTLVLHQFCYFQADYQEALRAGPISPEPIPWRVDWEGHSLWIDPDLEGGQISLRLEGVWLGVQAVKHWVGYRAEIRAKDLEIHVRLDKASLGPARYSLEHHQSAWNRLVLQCQQRADESLSQLFERKSFPAEWHSWLQDLVTEGWGQRWSRLHQLPIWPTLPQVTSLEQWLAQDGLAWSSLECPPERFQQFEREFPGRLLWPKLPAQNQANLAKLGGKWENFDAWLAQREQEQLFLQKQPLSLQLPDSLPKIRLQSESLEGLLALVEAPAKLTWMRWQRPLCEETQASLPYGFWGCLESSKLVVNPDFTQVGPEPTRQELLQQSLRHFTQLVESYLKELRPRPKDLEQAWLDWRALSPQVLERLQEQKWFETNRGVASWNELMQATELLRLDYASYPSDLLVVLESVNPARLLDSLCSRHPSSPTSKSSKKSWQDWNQSRQRKSRIDSLQNEMKNLGYQCQFSHPYEGRLAWTGGEDSQVWWVGRQESLPLDGWPTGWTGYLCPPLRNRMRLNEVLMAQISQSDRRLLLQQAQSALLQRIQAGQLKQVELRLTAAFCLIALHSENARLVSPVWQGLVEARWLPCADGSLLSLRQAFSLSIGEHLNYWRRPYPLAAQLDRPTLIIADETLLVLLSRWCEKAPRPRPKPLLFRDIRELYSKPFRGLLQSLASWVKAKPKRTLVQGIKEVMKATPPAHKAPAEPSRPAPPQPGPMQDQRQPDRDFQLLKQGQPLLTSLRRQARLLLTGQARKETLKILERMQWREQGPGPLWNLAHPPILNASHPVLQSLMKGPDREPHTDLVVSLLLGLVSAINARSLIFSDEMEQQFLEKLSHDLVETYKDLIPG